MESGQNRETIAKGFKIIGGIIMAISFVGLVGLIASHWMDIPHNYQWSKMLFCCGLGLSNTGNILSKLGPGQDKSRHTRAVIGIAMLLCCSVISIIFLITGFTTRIFVPLTLALVGDIIGGGFLSDDKDEENADKVTTETTNQDDEIK